LLPGLKRVAVVANPQHPGRQAEFAAAQEAAKKLSLTLDYFAASTMPELEAAFAGISKARSEAIVVFPDARMTSFGAEFARFASKNRIPAVSGWPFFADAGNLMTYGPQFEASFRHLASYVDKIFKGAKPADLPVELPTKFELIVNLKAARELGIKIPQSILVRADRMIK
jgi:putative ABC transport system substrate-binding protein